jgi:aspartyl-tRNA synthetase
VIAFPKLGDGSDPLTGAPSYVDPEQLQELGFDVEMEEHYD